MIKSWNDMPLDVYLRLLKTNDITDEGERTIAIVAALSDATTDEVCDLPIAEFVRRKVASSFVLQDLPPISGKIASDYNLGGVHYIPMTDIDKWTAIQYIDYNNLAKGAESNMVALLSCVLVPKGKTYGNGYDIADAQRAIGRELSVTQARGLLSVFLTALLNSVVVGATSSGKATTIREMRSNRRIRRAVKPLLTAGGGFITSTMLPHPLGEVGMSAINSI